MQPAQEGMGEGEGMLQGKHSSGISAGPILSPHPCSGWSCCLHPHSGDILLFPELFAALVCLGAGMSLNPAIQAWMGLLSPNPGFGVARRMGPIVLSYLGIALTYI